MSKVLGTVARVAGVVASAALLVGAVATGNPLLAASAAKIASIATLVGTAASPGADHLYHRPRKPMTAISMFADQRRAYIVTDGAQFDTTSGAVIGFVPKVLMFAKVQMAIAFQGGFITPAALSDAMADVCHEPKQSAFLACLPTALAQARLTMPVPLMHHTRLWVATVDPDSRRPRMFTVQSGRMPDGDGEPCRIEETDGLVTGVANLSEILPSGWPEHPVRDGLAILAAQRRASFTHMAGCSAVGGQCTLYSVSRTGVDYRHLIRYPDTIGKPVDPMLPGVLA